MAAVTSVTLCIPILVTSVTRRTSRYLVMVPCPNFHETFRWGFLNTDAVLDACPHPYETSRRGSLNLDVVLVHSHPHETSRGAP
ncbi:hypothetical protein PoB_006026400 [Plakobranchus ocellatus]|uniref:Secreted protein n=1 Tax=Plakobranchus ocellatus TaxID=259542 RepID=A0AAV4CPI0_9GAST|nr:hypothetical protein PoB_006026400 [Plakobranchus ocellatus]